MMRRTFTGNISGVINSPERVKLAETAEECASAELEVPEIVAEETSKETEEKTSA